MRDSLKRVEQSIGIKPDVVIGDRGFWSKKNEKWLKDENIDNAICPKNIVDLTKKLKDKEFVRLQNRRGQARQGIANSRFQKYYQSLEPGVWWKLNDRQTHL